jgi:hypothetical protein
MFDFKSIMSLLPAVGPIVAALPEFKKVFDQIVSTFKEDDQEELKAAYADLIADNDEGHARLQAKLDAASRR